jgi:HAE1 family hydrophobic/amphiphilic exporter-1
VSQPQLKGNFVTNRPVAILMVFVAAVVFGYFSYGRLPVTLMPELSYPTLTVRTEYPGAAPEEVENDITRPVEDALGVIGGLRRISSVSRAGVSDVILELSWDTAMSDAIQDTLEKLDLVLLPDEAKRPLILRFDPSLDPVMELSLSGSGAEYKGDEGLRRLRRIAELQVKRALEPIKGVAAVRVRGGLEEEIHVLLDDAQLRRAGIGVQDVITRLRQENINVAGGTLKEGRTEYMVRTLNEFQDLQQIEETIVAAREGKQVRVRDLGRVIWSNRERQITTRTDARESVQVEIFKEADANIVSLAHMVKNRLGTFDPEATEAAKETLPQSSEGPEARGRRGPNGLIEELFRNEGAIIKLVADRSVFIESSINEVRNTAILGGFLAIIVLLLFLRNLRSTMIIAVSIPISLLVTFAPLNLLGISLNIMSLGGLALGIGMLVDSSIVVLESIYRCREEGDDIITAAVRGTGEVRMAVIASILTTIAVFFPMVFVEGVAGQAFGDLGLAVVISLLASLLVAVFFIPMLASRQGLAAASTAGVSRPSLVPTSFLGMIVTGFRGGFKWWHLPLLPFRTLALLIGFIFEAIAKAVLSLLILLSWVFARLSRSRMSSHTEDTGAGAMTRFYSAMVGWALRNRLQMVLIAVLCMALTVHVALRVDNELLPEVHQGEFTIETQLPVGTPLEETAAILGPIEQAIMAERDRIQSLIVTLGFDPTTSQRSDEGEHTARFKVILDTSDPRVEERVANRLRRHMAGIPDLDARVVRPVLFSFRTPIEVEVHGDDLMRLRETCDQVRQVMESLSELTDVETTQRSGAPEVQIQYDRDQLSRYGLNIEQVASQVRDAVKGYEATLYNLGDRRIPIVVRFEEEDRSHVTHVRDFIVNPGGKRPIPLSSVAAIELAEGPSEVRRVEGSRVALVTANIGAGSLGTATARIEQELRQRIDWPADMTFFISGQNQEWNRSRGSLLLALALSVFLVYVIMAAQFESLLQPLIIMLTIPLAFFGTVLALFYLKISLSVVVFLGMIMLAGIVVNNAIVLVDYINTLRRNGMGRDEAVITAGTVRLRPILMTTATTVLGLLPMALGFGDGAEIRTPMAIAVISGLLASTALTLLIIPSIYSLLDAARTRLLGRSRAGREGSPETAVEESETETAGLGVSSS